MIQGVGELATPPHLECGDRGFESRCPDHPFGERKCVGKTFIKLELVNWLWLLAWIQTRGLERDVASLPGALSGKRLARSVLQPKQRLLRMKSLRIRSRLSQRSLVTHR